jgi:peptide deformylase
MGIAGVTSSSTPGGVRVRAGCEDGRVTNGANDPSELLRIVAIGEPVLRRAAEPVDPAVIKTAEFQRLIDQMRATMTAAPGVGLAAPQVGIGIRLAVIEDGPERWVGLDASIIAERERTELGFTVLVNPVVERVAEAGAVTFYEGCLSVPGYAGAVERARTVRLSALGADGEPFSATYTGWPARIVQHEVDHLDGRIYVDRVATRSLSTVENLANRPGRPIAELAEEFGFAISPGQTRPG